MEFNLCSNILYQMLEVLTPLSPEEIKNGKGCVQSPVSLEMDEGKIKKFSMR